jgi:hypothetical protein
VRLEITVTRKSRVDHVSVRVRWPRNRDRGPDPPLPRIQPARARGASHLDFTSPSSGRNAGARDSRLDADHGCDERDGRAPAE